MIFTATTATDPMVKGEWIEEGAHICGMIGAPHFDARRELDDEVGRRADIVVVNSLSQVKEDLQPEIWNPIRKGYLTWDFIHELVGSVHWDLSGTDGQQADHLAQQQCRHGHSVRFGVQAGDREGARARIGTELPVDMFVGNEVDETEEFTI